MRRRIAGAVLALGAAVLLGLRWYDTGSTRRTGIQLLWRIADRPDDVPGLGWARIGAVLAVLTVLAGVGLALSPARRRPEWAGAGRPTDPAVWWTAGGAAAGAVAAGLAAWRLGGIATAVVPAAAVLLAGGALGLPLVVRGRGRSVPVAGVALAVVVALGVTLGAPWFAEGRFVRRTETGVAAPANPDAAPAAPGRLAWTRDATDAYVGGGYAVVSEGGGPGSRVVVLDAATGRERWSYRNTDAYAFARVSPADGIVLIRRNRDDAIRLLAFDLPSGRPLWTMSTSDLLIDSSPSFNDDLQLLSPGAVLLTDDDRRVTAVDPRTGAHRWTRDDLACFGGTGATRAGEVFVLTGLCRSTTVRAVRVDTGELAWEAEVSDGPIYTRAAERPPLVVAGTVVLPLIPRDGALERLVAVDTGTGRVRWTADWDPGVLPPVVAGGRVVTVESGRGALAAVARDPATGRVAWRTPVGVGTAGGDVERVAAGAGDRFYLLSGTVGGPARVEVLDAAGRAAGTTEVPGVTVTGSSAAVASGGALVVLVPRGFRPRPVAAIV